MHCGQASRSILKWSSNYQRLQLCQVCQGIELQLLQTLVDNIRHFYGEAAMTAKEARG